jgi:hypothetical protein
MAFFIGVAPSNRGGAVGVKANNPSSLNTNFEVRENLLSGNTFYRHTALTSLPFSHVKALLLRFAGL